MLAARWALGLALVSAGGCEIISGISGLAGASGSVSSTSSTSSSAASSTSSGSSTSSSSSGGADLLVGDSTVETHPNGDPAGQAQAFQFVAVMSGSSSHVALFVDQGNLATGIQVGIYDDNGSNGPGTLLGTSSISNPAQLNWNVASLPGASIAAGTKYWLAILAPVGGGEVDFRTQTPPAPGNTSISASAQLTTLPTTWSNGGASMDGPVSAYVY